MKRWDKDTPKNRGNNLTQKIENKNKRARGDNNHRGTVDSAKGYHFGGGRSNDRIPTRTDPKQTMD